MEVPDKIYITECMLFATNPEITLPQNNKIEYIRTDTFIEKTCAFLKDRIDHDSIDYPMATKHLINDYIKYMKGE